MILWVLELASCDLRRFILWIFKTESSPPVAEGHNMLKKVLAGADIVILSLYSVNYVHSTDSTSQFLLIETEILRFA